MRNFSTLIIDAIESFTVVTDSNKIAKRDDPIKYTRQSE